MENNSKSGTTIFEEFVKSIPEEFSTFDYFSLLEETNKTKFDKDSIILLLQESKSNINIFILIIHYYY